MVNLIFLELCIPCAETNKNEKIKMNFKVQLMHAFLLSVFRNQVIECMFIVD